MTRTVQGCLSGFGMKLSDTTVAVIGVGEDDENQALELRFGPDSLIWLDGDRVRSAHAFIHAAHEATDCVHVRYESPLRATFTTGCRQ